MRQTTRGVSASWPKCVASTRQHSRLCGFQPAVNSQVLPWSWPTGLIIPMVRVSAGKQTSPNRLATRFCPSIWPHGGDELHVCVFHRRSLFR